jgi:hypothetical protein
LPALTEVTVRGPLARAYDAAGFAEIGVRELAPGNLAEFATTWGKRLEQDRDRRFFAIALRASNSR